MARREVGRREEHLVRTRNSAGSSAAALVKFTKMHGCGNDYVLIDDLRDRSAVADWPSLARQMCDRHFGVGSDGLLVVQSSDRADFRMRMFNPDGSESEMCGNGIRCFGKFVYDAGLAPGRELAVETGNGILTLRVHAEGPHQRLRAERLTVAMGVPELRPDRVPVVVPGQIARDLPIDGVGCELRVTCVSMGNPHAVAFVEAPVAEYPLREVGPRVERHRLFPRRVNFEIVNVLAPDRVAARVWERGAGETLACGTGACAIAVAARLHGLIGDRVRVELPGGALEIEWDGRGPVMMTGPATTVFEGQWPG